MDHLVTQAEMVIQEHQEMMDHPAAPVLMLKSEMNSCLYHLNVNAFLHLDLLDHPVVVEMTDHQETMAHPAAQDNLEIADPTVHPELLDNPDALEIQDHLEKLELFALAKPHHPVHLDNLVVPDNLDRPADPENLVKMVTTDLPDNLEALEEVDHPDVTVNPDNKEIPDLLDHQAAVTTVHQLVWLPDIRIRTHTDADFRTKHSRGHLYLSFLYYLDWKNCCNTHSIFFYIIFQNLNNKIVQ
jgi:hypothetical protein